MRSQSDEKRKKYQSRIDAFLTREDAEQQPPENYKIYNEKQKNERVKALNQLEKKIQAGEEIDDLFRAKLYFYGIDEQEGKIISSPPDYCEGDGIVGIFEIKGKRATQEDRVYSERDFEALESIPSSEIKFLLRQFFKEMQRQCGNHYNEGSTATCCTIRTCLSAGKVMLQIQNAHVGDSEAYLFTINKKTKQCVYSKKFNEHYSHHLKGNDRLISHAGHLSVCRSIGDRAYEGFHSPKSKKPFSHIPDLEFVEREMKPDEVNICLMNCDGLTEAGLTQEKIGAIIAANWNQPPEKIAFKLGEAAYRAGSKDNISVMVTCIPECDPKAFEAFTAFNIVADGHGGQQVSQAIKEFAPQFEVMVENYIKNRPDLERYTEEIRKIVDDAQAKMVEALFGRQLKQFNNIRDQRKRNNYEECAALNDQLKHFLHTATEQKQAEFYFNVEEKLLQPLRADYKKSLALHHKLGLYLNFLETADVVEAPADKQRRIPIHFSAYFSQEDKTLPIKQEFIRTLRAKLEELDKFFLNGPAQGLELKQ